MNQHTHNTILLVKSQGFLERFRYGRYKECFIRLPISVDGGSEVQCLFGMSDRGFVAIMDAQQFKGETTYQHLEVERIKTAMTLDRHRFWYALGRKHIDGITLTPFNTVAYILGVEEWSEADVDTLFTISAI